MSIRNPRLRGPLKWLGLGLLLTAYYLLVVYLQGFFNGMEDFLVRFAPDSAEFLEVANWLFDGDPNGMIQRRTFLYPLLVGLVRAWFGVKGIWAWQMLMWIGTALIFYANLCQFLKSQRLRFALMGLFCLSLTPILLSILILGETLVMFLLSFAMFWLCHFWQRSSMALSVLVLSVIAGLLMGIKPNYGPLFYSVLAFFCILKVAGRLSVSWPALLGALILAAVPLLVQNILYFKGVGAVGTTNMGSHVVRVSLYPQVLAQASGGDFHEIRERVMQENPPNGVILRFLAQHPFLTFSSFLRNLEENLRTVLHVQIEPNPWVHKMRRKLNSFYFYVHCLMLIPLLGGIWRARQFQSAADFRLVVGALLFFTALLPTGVTFWAADRWTAPLLSVWPLLYIWAFPRPLFEKIQVLVSSQRFQSSTK